MDSNQLPADRKWTSEESVGGWREGHRIHCVYCSYAILFSILYQYQKMIPASYQVNMLGTTLTDKIYVYIAATQVNLITSVKLYALLTRPNCSFCYPTPHHPSFHPFVD